MPLRSFPSPLAIRLLRTLFHTSAVCRDAPHPNHYETLQIPIHASPSEIKKSFYTLSKTHHPDRNPNDPSASHRFVQISEAYSILGTPEKRSKYDREHIHLQTHQVHYSSHPRGSYHSSNPAGGRPASGLSRRRTQFRGPPPSFYRSGGWGEYSAKRRKAQDNGAPGAKAPPDYSSAEMGAGMGAAESPFGRMDNVPHFDREAHYRTQQNQSKRWQRRNEDFVPSGQVEPSSWFDFFFVGGIVALAVLLPTVVFENMSMNRNQRENR